MRWVVLWIGVGWDGGGGVCGVDRGGRLLIGGLRREGE